MMRLSLQCRAVCILTAAICTFVLLIQPCRQSTARAGGVGPISTTQAYPAPPILASAAALLDADSGTWLLLKSADRKLPMASTTKIMTAILAIEHGHLNDLAFVSHAAASVGETTMGLQYGERVRMRDLLFGMMLPSGNDAAITIAEHVAGSQTRFAALMNAKARALGLRHTHYVNSYGFVDTPDGDDPNHYTSARDLTLLAQYAMRNALFRKVVSTKSYSVPATSHNLAHHVSSINYFIYWYPGADGVKPGWTSGAGICLVMDARRHGRHLVGAVLNTPNLYTDERDMLNYGFGDFTWFASKQYGDTTDRTVAGGTPGDPSLYFPYTGHSIRAGFLRFVLDHGGTRVFGMPRTQEFIEGGVSEQYFTNQVLAYDANAQAVIPLRIGIAAVPANGWLARVPYVGATYWRSYYPQTGHTVTWSFREFYLAHGGPRTFGYPITEKRFLHGRLVQYFENAEFVWHATSSYSGYVTLAPLGEQRLANLGFLSRPLPTIHPVTHLHLKPVRFVGPRPTATSSPTPAVIAQRTAVLIATSISTALALPSRTTTPTFTRTATSTPPLPSATFMPSSTKTPPPNTPILPTPTPTSRRATATSSTTSTPRPRSSPTAPPTIIRTDTPVVPFA